MKITNHFDLPMPFVRAVGTEQHSKPGEISVTELIGPALIRNLTAKHWDQLEEDASERVWSVFGTALHNVLESFHDPDEELVELNLSKNLDDHGILALVGHPDILTTKNGFLTDYKVTSVWSIIFGGKDEWEAQLNLYAYLMREAGYAVTAVQNVVFLRDWQRSQAKYDTTYPQNMVLTLPQKLWSDAEVQAYITRRVAAHAAVEPCTALERWERPTTYAVIKVGAKRATKVWDNMNEAMRHAGELGEKYSVAQRKGVSPRCESYCPVRAFCPHRVVGGDE